MRVVHQEHQEFGIDDAQMRSVVHTCNDVKVYS
jgi:hypothetical protein